MLLHRTRPPRSARVNATDEGLAARQRRLRHDVLHCAIPRDHITAPRANRRVRTWLADTLSALGLDVSIRGELGNVVALPPGTATAPLTLVGAHYDSVPLTPGADDNASAVAVMLEVARGCRAHPWRPVGFVAFNAEERGLAGSRQLVRDEVLSGRLPVHAVHVLEMVGFTSLEPGSQRSPVRIPGTPDVGDFIGLLANQASRAVLSRVLDRARRTPEAPPTVALQTWLGSERWLRDLHRSDHAPFWEAGVPAVLWTDTAEFRNPHYHRPTDTPDTLDYAFMAAVTALLEASLDVSSPEID